MCVCVCACVRACVCVIISTRYLIFSCVILEMYKVKSYVVVIKKQVIYLAGCVFCVC